MGSKVEIISTHSQLSMVDGCRILSEWSNTTQLTREAHERYDMEHSITHHEN